MTYRFSAPLASVALAAALAACAPLPNQDYVARNGLFVFSRDAGRFEVRAAPGTAGPAYFCAAGDYARVQRNAAAADRVVMVRPDGPSGALPGARSAIFAIAPPGSRTLPPISTVPMGRAGASLPVATAQALCRPDRNSPRTFGG